MGKIPESVQKSIVTSNLAENEATGSGQEDLLWQQLKTVPAFRALLRSVESQFYQHIRLPEPVLDLGCGDGHFAEMTFNKPLSVGIDPWWGPINKAKGKNAYQLLVQGYGNRLPFPDESFACVISNSVLEHIPDIQPVLNEVGRVLQSQGLFIFTTPNHNFTDYLGGALMFEKFSLKRLANAYRRFFNWLSRHAHTDSPEIWSERLALAGLTVDRWQYYFSKKALHGLELGHLQGLPSAVLHFLAGHWIVAPYQSSLYLTDKWIRPYYEEKSYDQGTMTLMIARKVSTRPIPAQLPPAAPFSTS